MTSERIETWGRRKMAAFPPSFDGYADRRGALLFIQRKLTATATESGLQRSP
jgi:hypothetical protein